MNKVRATHWNAGNRVRNVTNEYGTLGNEARFDNTTINTVIWNALKADLEAAFTPSQLTWSSCYTDALDSYIPLNQFQYAMTQWIFSAIQTVSRDLALVPNATDDELDSFNYAWGVLGHMMGIDDSYNIALQENLTATNAYYQDILTFYMIPAMYNLNNVSKYFIELTASRAENVPIVSIKFIISICHY